MTPQELASHAAQLVARSDRGAALWNLVSCAHEDKTELYEAYGVLIVARFTATGDAFADIGETGRFVKDAIALAVHIGFDSD